MKNQNQDDIFKSKTSLLGGKRPITVTFVGRVDDRRARKYNHSNKSIVYDDINGRPFNNGDIMGDFEWRHTVKGKKIIKEIIKQAFMEHFGLGATDFSIGFDRKAGCFCGCSPGYVVKYAKGKGPNLPMEYWVTTPKKKEVKK